MHSLNHSLVTVKVNNKINRLHETCLRVTYNDGLSSFEELFERDNSVSVHNRNIQCLAIELYKVFHGIYPDIMRDVFPLSTSSNYDIRSRRNFTTRSIKTVYYGTDSLSYLATKVCELIPNNIKPPENFPKFKRAIKNWKPAVCPCRLCKLYFPLCVVSVVLTYIFFIFINLFVYFSQLFLTFN